MIYPSIPSDTIRMWVTSYVHPALLMASYATPAPRTVLIVDDNADMRLYVRSRLLYTQVRPDVCSGVLH